MSDKVVLWQSVYVYLGIKITAGIGIVGVA